MPAKTQREREAEARRAKLDRISEQVKDGSLVIRKMTDDERARFVRARRQRLEPSPAPRPRRRSPRGRSSPPPARRV